MPEGPAFRVQESWAGSSDLYREAVSFLFCTTMLLIFRALPCDTEDVLSSVS